MANKGFNPKDLENMQDFLELQEKIASNMRTSTLSFVKAAREGRKARKDAEAAEKRILKIQEEQARLEKEKLNASKEEQKILQNRIDLLNQEKKKQEEIVDENRALSAALKNQTKSIKNIGIAIGRDIGKGLKFALKTAKDLSLEYFEQDKTVRRTAVNIGLMGKQQEAFRKTVYKSAIATQKLGMDASSVAETYGSYAETVGRLIPLTEKSALAMTKMAMGTALGKEGAAEMAANMEVFGMSIESTASYVEDVANMSEKMGVNSGKVLKSLSQNMRKAQTVRFKGGVEGMAKMAAKAAKIRFDMSAALGFAQDLWEPEKAIETAANLQMMGGAFAKMGDPIRLMFLGRNDPATLMNELADAAASVVKNMGDGTYDIPAMELQKLKQIAEATGQDFQALVETAKTSARQKDIERMLSPKIGKEGKEFISSIAEYSKEKGGFVVSVDGEVKKVSELTQEQISAMITADESLKERAKAAQDTMSLFKNFFNSFKNLAFSFLSGVEKTLRKPLERLMGTGEGSLMSFSDSLSKLGESFGAYLADFITKIPDYIETIKQIPDKVAKAYDAFINWEGWKPLKTVGGAIVSVGKTMWKFASSFVETMNKTFGPNGLLMAGLVLVFRKQIANIIGSMMQQFLRDKLGRGSSPTYPMFTRDVFAGGMGGGMGMGGGGGKFYKGGQFMPGGGRAPKGGMWSGGGKGFGGMGRGMGRGLGGMFRGGGLLRGLGGAAMGLGIAGLAMDVGRSFLDDPDSAFGKGLGVGSAAAMGAGLGSMLGPVGTLAGGLLGAIYGAYKEFSKKSESMIDQKGLSNSMSAIASRSVGGATTTMGDGLVTIDQNDKALIVGTSKQKNATLAESVNAIAAKNNGGGGGGSTGGSNNINLTVNGSIELKGRGKNFENLLENAEFRRMITSIVISEMDDQNK